ncbi:hypothetical protein B0H13DRAFT_2009534 [Mycena leptocephala]|nr:hypothetical protein B0H13DRAFT_2009534 [Mycena leptocephala]
MPASLPTFHFNTVYALLYSPSPLPTQISLKICFCNTHVATSFTIVNLSMTLLRLSPELQQPGIRVRTRVRDTALCEFNGVSVVAYRRLMALPDQGCATAARNVSPSRTPLTGRVGRNRPSGARRMEVSAKRMEGENGAGKRHLRSFVGARAGRRGCIDQGSDFQTRMSRRAPHLCGMVLDRRVCMLVKCLVCFGTEEMKEAQKDQAQLTKSKTIPLRRVRALGFRP